MAAGVFYFWRSFWAIFIPIAASLMMLGRRMNMISDREITRQTLMHVEQQLAAPTLRVMHVQATEFWKINEVEDEGATYIFKVGERQWLLIHGQDFAPQKRFPSMEFKIVMGISDSLIQIKGLGEKSEPTRVLPANKNGVLSPIGKFYLVVDAEENIVIQTLENEIERGYRQV